MRRIYQLLQTLLSAAVVVCGLVCTPQPVVSAEATNASSLTISQLKITSSNGQFVTLYNASGATLDMSKFQLEYFNSYDLSKATSSRLISLSGTLPSHGYYMVSDDSLLLCYQMSVASMSLGFSSTAGMVEVLGFNQSSAGGSVVPTLQDYVSWSKASLAGVQTLPTNTSASLLRQPVDALHNPQVGLAGAGSWQLVLPDPNNPCGLVTYSGSTPIGSGMSQLLPGAEPEAIVLDGNPDQPLTASASLPGADIGLMAPRVTEILPNPVGTGNDATDEFIELYNPNPVSFDLTGFSLQVGTTTLHSFTFPAGTQLPPQGYVAYYSTDTGLNLSNTSGQAALLDPMGNSLSKTDLYATAKDGYGWALANGSWAWTTRLTPNAANIVVKPAVATKKVAAAKASKKAAAAKKPLSASKPAKLTASTVGAGSDAVPLTPVHLQTLVVVAAIAVLYGAYEYRADITNRLYQLSCYLGLRRRNRPESEGR